MIVEPAELPLGYEVVRGSYSHTSYTELLNDGSRRGGMTVRSMDPDWAELVWDFMVLGPLRAFYGPAFDSEGMGV